MTPATWSGRFTGSPAWTTAGWRSCQRETGSLRSSRPPGSWSGRSAGLARVPANSLRPDFLQYLPPDTLAVWDLWFGPVAYFDPEGNLLKQRSLDLGLIIERTGGNAESPRHPMPDGSFVIRATGGDPIQPAPGSVYRGSPTDFLRVDSSYATHHLGAWPLMEMWYPGPGIDAPPFPYYYVVDSHVAGGGDPLVIYVSEGDRNEIHQFAPDGTLLRIIRRTTDPVPLTDRSRQAWLQAAGEGEDPRILEMQPVRESYPPVGALVVDTEGYLWVRNGLLPNPECRINGAYSALKGAGWGSYPAHLRISFPACLTGLPAGSARSFSLRSGGTN